MSQVSDVSLANQSFGNFRTELNNILGALNSMHSGTSRPSSAVQGTIWLDTTNSGSNSLEIKFFDGSDDISFATVNTSANTINFIDSTVTFDIVNDTSPQLGGDLSLNSNDITGTGNITFTGNATITGNVSASGTISGKKVWESKSSSFTAEAQKRYFVNTSGGVVTATLPASPTIGDEIRFVDANATFDTNNLTVGRNGKPIMGDASDLTVATERASFGLVFYDNTQGWLLMEK